MFYARAGGRCLRAGLLLVSFGAPLCLGVRSTAAAEPGQIDVAYLPPKNPAHQPLYELLKGKHALEKIQALQEAGATQFNIYLMCGEEERQLEEYAKNVLPKFQ